MFGFHGFGSIIRPMIKRSLDLSEILKRKSLFLFGPRQTGKTTFLKNFFPDAIYISLLSGEHFRLLSNTPEKLIEMIRYGNSHIIIIDEIQKVPNLLDQVQYILQDHPHLRFILTGSSPRKLKKNGINLLGGRASWVNFHPFCYPELIRNHDMNLQKWLELGCLPSILFSSAPEDELSDYVNLYLNEEIKQETNIRNLDQFSRFLEIAALNHGQQIIFSNIGSDAEVKAKTVRDYFQVLEDTLIARLVPVFQKTNIRKPMTSAKLYFFDQGIVNILTERRHIKKGTPEYGTALEHFVYKELLAYNHYFNKKFEINYWRTTSQIEVDFILAKKDGPTIAIEVKAKNNVSPKDLKGLLAFKEEYPDIKFYLICSESMPRKTAEGVEIIPIELFLKKLWNHEFSL